MAEKSGPTSRLDALAEHVGEDGPPLRLFDQLFFDILHLNQQRAERSKTGPQQFHRSIR